VPAIWETAVASVQRLATARPGFVLAALGLYVASHFIVASRLRRFLRMIGASVPVWRAALAGLAGIAVGNLMPSSRLGGEACRIALVRKAGDATWRQATIASMWDRLSEVPPITVLVIMAMLAARDLPARARTLALAVGVAILFVAGTFALRALRRSNATLAGWRERLALDSLAPSVFLTGVGFSTLVWVQDVLRLTCSALAFGVVLTPTQMALLSVAAMLSGMVPTVGGIGPVEGALVAGFVAFGVDLPTAAAITAAERMVSYGFSTSTGSLVVAFQGGRSLWGALRRRTPLPQ
jgi:uncharacterized membrane protein YbhN (UPF0104 family)